MSSALHNGDSSMKESLHVASPVAGFIVASSLKPGWRGSGVASPRSDSCTLASALSASAATRCRASGGARFICTSGLATGFNGGKGTTMTPSNADAIEQSVHRLKK